MTSPMLGVKVGFRGGRSVGRFESWFLFVGISGIPGLPISTLFQPFLWADLRPAVSVDLLPPDGSVRVFNLDPVIYDLSYNCLENCEEILQLAQLTPDGGFFCKFWDCDDDADQMRDLIFEAVQRQNIFDVDNGYLKKGYVERFAVYECVVGHIDPSECVTETFRDGAEGGISPRDLFEVVSAMTALLPAGHRPKKLCPDQTTPGGTYRLVTSGGAVGYVGETNNFAVRRAFHNLDRRTGGPNNLRRSDLDFEIVQRVPDRQVRRGLEQRDYLDQWSPDAGTSIPYSQRANPEISAAQAGGSVNGQRPMRSQNQNYDVRLGLAELFLDLCL